jgi:amino acid transporter
LALALVPIVTIQQDDKVQFALLAHMGYVAGGQGWFGKLLSGLISVDAVLVLSGAVLTSFVGVNGLVRRMTLDRCLPQFLLKENARGTTHRILLGFFVLSVSVHVITRGDIEALAGVYTISFLTVMALFAIGNILLKVKRDQLPRPVKATWATVLVAIAGVTVGLAGNAVRDPEYLVVFLSYFVPSMAAIAIMLYRIPLLKMMLGVVRAITASLVGPLTATSKWVRDKIEEINSQQVVFFTRGDNVANLNSAMLYVAGNEDTNRIKVVTVIKDPSDVPERMEQDLQFLDEAYPEIDIEFVVLEGKFGPELIQELSEKWHVPTNLMFIGSPGGKLIYGLAELGGVRLII